MSSDPTDWRAVATERGALQAPVYRVVTCHRWSHGPGPAIYRQPAGEAAEFIDLHTCGSVWMCPVCAAKITSRRRLELMALISAATGRGFEVSLVTRTFSHDKRTFELPELLKLFGEALSRSKGATRARKLAQRAGVAGAVRALEVTHGEINGWHPHSHDVVIHRPGERGRIATLRNGWIRELVKRGLAGMRDTMTRAERAEQLRYLRRHAFVVHDGQYASEYVAKFGMEPATEGGGRWGQASELTKGHQKTGARFTGRTPFELLRLYVEEGDRRAGFLFREFALAFQGRAQLYWSPKLRAAMIELCRETAEQIYFTEGASAENLAWRARAATLERDDDDIVLASQRDPGCTEFVLRLTSDEWRVVLRLDARADVLFAAQLGGEPEVRELLGHLRRSIGQDAARGGARLDSGQFVADWRRFDRGRWYDAGRAA